MQTATETERKYDVPESFALPSLTGVAGITTADGAETHDLDATYFDTDELNLMQNSRTLRRRTGGGDAGWHLKTPGDGAGRTEHRLPLGDDAHREDVPDELAGLVRAIIRDRPLRPVARLRTHRVETPLRDAEGRTLALVAQDQVTAETDGGTQRWQEIEVELVDGDAAVLAAVEKRLLAAGATPAAGPSKVARALGDRLTAARGKNQTKNKIHPVLRYAREQRDAITEFDPGVRVGDPEAVHKMRVGTRRLRSTLKTFKRSFPAEVADLGDELKWLAGLLGEVRDGQVLEHKLLAGVREAGPDFAAVADRIHTHLHDQVARGQAALDQELNGRRYLRVLERVDRLVDDPDEAEDDPLKRARKSLAKADGLLDTALADGVDAELHEARKSYKRARYAVEVFEPSAGKPAKALVKALTELQDVLGAHQDSVVARELLAEIGPDDFHFGVLWARQEQVGRETHAQLPVVVETSRKKKLRKWLG
ncbi:CYTH and CHAD domain-containing protein [Micromonosporaceae bacterium Da 78-11]